LTAIRELALIVVVEVFSLLLGTSRRWTSAPEAGRDVTAALLGFVLSFLLHPALDLLNRCKARFTISMARLPRSSAHKLGDFSSKTTT